MKTAIAIAILLQLVIHNSAQARTSESGKNLSLYLKQKMVPKPSQHIKPRKRIPRKKAVDVKVKVYGARQYTVDLLVTCRNKNILLTYNKVDKKFCTVKFKCRTSLRAAIRPYCK